MKLRDKLLIIFGIPAMIFITYGLTSGCPSTVRCKGPVAYMQQALSNTRVVSESWQDSGKSLKGFCADKEVKKILSEAPRKFIIECKDSENSYTVSGIDPKNPDNITCIDGKGNATSTARLTTQDGIECK